MCDVSCALCGELLRGKQELADCHIYKMGVLSYIEVAHKACAEQLDPAGMVWQWAPDQARVNP